MEIPFTFDLRPTLLLKEALCVDARHRAAGVGRALFEQVRAHGRGRGGGRLVWTVLPDNAPPRPSIAGPAAPRTPPGSTGNCH